MFSQKRVYLIIGFILIFSGCTSTNTNKITEVKQNDIQKLNKVVDKKEQIKDKIVTKYTYCNKYITIMNHNSKYIQKEFDKEYFIKRDVLGVKEQLLLIENNSQSIFAKNINNGVTSYNKQYSQAKKNKCNLSKYRISPLNKVKLKLKRLEKYMLKKVTQVPK